MIRGIVFDFDGVIVESADIKTRAFESLFAAWPGRLDEIRRYHLEHAGISRYVKFRQIYGRILGLPYDGSVECELGERFAALVEAEVTRAPLVKGAREFLDAARGRYLTFLTSGTPEDELRRIVAARGLAELFDGVFGSPATKPRIIRDVCARHGLRPKELVFVGDGQSDEDASRETGVTFIARVHDGSTLRGGRWSIRDLTDLEATLDQIALAAGREVR